MKFVQKRLTAESVESDVMILRLVFVEKERVSRGIAQERVRRAGVISPGGISPDSASEPRE